MKVIGKPRVIKDRKGNKTYYIMIPREYKELLPIGKYAKVKIQDIEFLTTTIKVENTVYVRIPAYIFKAYEEKLKKITEQTLIEFEIEFLH